MLRIVLLHLLAAAVNDVGSSASRNSNGPKPPHCPQYHTLSYNDPSGPVQTPDGIWHIFPINGNWGNRLGLTTQHSW